MPEAALPVADAVNAAEVMTALALSLVVPVLREAITVELILVVLVSF